MCLINFLLNQQNLPSLIDVSELLLLKLDLTIIRTKPKRSAKY